MKGKNTKRDLGDGFGNMISYLRKKRNWSLVELAEETRPNYVSPTYIYID